MANIQMQFICRIFASSPVGFRIWENLKQGRIQGEGRGRTPPPLGIRPPADPKGPPFGTF